VTENSDHWQAVVIILVNFQISLKGEFFEWFCDCEHLKKDSSLLNWLSESSN
jgi:hypothetical protein